MPSHQMNDKHESVGYLLALINIAPLEKGILYKVSKFVQLWGVLLQYYKQ